MKPRPYMIRNDASNYRATSNFIACTTALAQQAEVSVHDQQIVAAFAVGLEGAIVLNTGYACALSNALQITPLVRQTIFIADLGDPRLFLRHPLPVIVEYTGTQVSAYSYDLEELAVGPDEGAAITEMKALIAESYLLLKGEQSSLGPLQLQHWAFLRRLVGEVVTCR